LTLEDGEKRVRHTDLAHLYHSDVCEADEVWTIPEKMNLVLANQLTLKGELRIYGTLGIM
jgi:hypothetical protein